MNFLESLVNKNVQIYTLENRIFQGNLYSLDQSTNIILQHCKERIMSDEDCIFEEMGVYFIRGDSIVIISKL